MTENERNELIRFIESITFNAPKDGKPSWIKPAFDMIKEVIINKIDDIYNENEMREIELHRKSYKELQKTVTDLSLENCLLKNKVEEMKWIPCSERLPEDLDNRFYMCILENHEDDLPVFMQFDEELGFGYWVDHFHPQTLGYLCDEFKTTEELEYEKVIAWMDIPEYKGEKND